MALKIRCEKIASMVKTDNIIRIYEKKSLAGIKKNLIKNHFLGHIFGCLLGPSIPFLLKVFKKHRSVCNFFCSLFLIGFLKNKNKMKIGF